AGGVGDDVVKLTGDPRTLLRHRDACRDLALTLRPDRAYLGRLGLLGMCPHREARDPRGDEPKRDEDVPARQLMTGDVQDQDLHRADDDAETEDGLPAIAQVPEQERGREADD